MLLRVILDQVIGAEALATGLAVHQRIGEAGEMAGGDPGLRVHQDGTVNADILRGFLHEFFPPRLLDIILQLHAERAVIPCIGKSAVNLRAGINETAAAAQIYDFVHRFLHDCLSSSY